MKLLTYLLGLFLSFFFTIHAFSQGVLKEWDKRFRWQGKDFIIYEASKNIGIKDGEIRQVSDYSYYFMPELKIKDISLNEYEGDYRLLLEVEPSYPPIAEIAEFIKDSHYNRYVQVSSIHPMTVYWIAAKYKRYGIKTEFDEKDGGYLLDKLFELVLVFDDYNYAEKAKTDLLFDGKLQLNLGLHQMFQESACWLEEGIDYILSSDVYRKFVSPVEGKRISVNHAREISKKLTDEISIKIICISNDDAFKIDFRKFIEKILFPKMDMMDLFGPSYSTEDALTDLENERYSSDIINRFLIDMDFMTNEEWCEKYHERLIDFFSKDNKYNSFGKYFFAEGNFNFDRKKTTNKEEELSVSNCGKSDYRDAFKKEILGRIVLPKTINTVDVINSREVLRQNYKISMEYYKQKLASLKVYISM